MTEFLQSKGYSVFAVIRLEEVDQALNGSFTIKLALVDISGFDAGIWAFCQRLRQQEIPFLVISPSQQAAIQRASLMRGALGLLVKPLVMRDLLQLVRSLVKGDG
ncbi:response regulator transcription factor [Phormidium tenue FACHB-886]|nr:response regulator transcription factor [Phormidium tenue FACHB-886]